MKKSLIFGVSLFALPQVTFAVGFQPIIDLVVGLMTIINLFIPILVAATIVIFFWGLFLYVKGGGKKRDSGKRIIIAGLIAIFIEVSLSGIINFLNRNLDVQKNDSVLAPPKVPPAGSSASAAPTTRGIYGGGSASGI